MGHRYPGFVPSEFTGELYVRWFQFAAFTPLFPRTVQQPGCWG
jgi:alpha-glucosidase (family GH31 glycosyl hydrolase)